MEPTPMYCFSQTCLTSPSLTWVFSNRRIANRKVMVLANRFLSTNAFLILKARRGVGRDDWRDEGKAQKIKDINQLLFRYGNRRFKTAPKKSSKIVLKTYILRKSLQHFIISICWRFGAGNFASALEGGISLLRLPSLKPTCPSGHCKWNIHQLSYRKHRD